MTKMRVQTVIVRNIVCRDDRPHMSDCCLMIDSKLKDQERGYESRMSWRMEKVQAESEVAGD